MILTELCHSKLPLQDKLQLIDCVFEAHAQAAITNENISNIAFMQAASGSGDFVGGVIAALASLGNRHGPIADARHFIYERDDEEQKYFCQTGQKIPGWGNSFFKGTCDPAWLEVAELIESKYPLDHQALSIITGMLDNKVLPNAAAYSAVAAELLGMPRGTEPLLFIIPRLPVWAFKFAGLT